LECSEHTNDIHNRKFSCIPRYSWDIVIDSSEEYVRSKYPTHRIEDGAPIRHSQFGMTHFINGWAVHDGFIPPLLLLMGMTVGFAIIGMVLLMIFGKSARRLTRKSIIHGF
jgi:hypothetical protein